MFNKKRKHGQYLILSEKELAQNTEVEVLNVIQEDVVAKIPNGSLSKDVILRKAKFLCMESRDKTIEKLKIKLSVGEENFTEYYSMKQKVNQFENEIKRMNIDLTSLRNRADDSNDKLNYLKGHLGNDAFNNLMNNLAKRKSGEANKETGQPTSLG